MLRKFQDAINKKAYEPAYDSDGVLIDEGIGNNTSHLSLNEAVLEGMRTPGTLFALKASPEDMESWPPENRKLYQQLEAELQAIRDSMPNNPSDRSQEILDEVAKAMNKVIIVATFGESHSMTEAMVEEASDVYMEEVEENTEVAGEDEGSLTSLLISKGQTPEELEEKLKKLKDDLIKQISTPDANAGMNTAQQGGSKNTLSETPSTLDNSKTSAQQATQAHNTVDMLEIQRMNNGLKHYERASVSI